MHQCKFLPLRLTQCVEIYLNCQDFPGRFIGFMNRNSPTQEEFTQLRDLIVMCLSIRIHPIFQISL